jgi:hypothetical protein
MYKFILILSFCFLNVSLSFGQAKHIGKSGIEILKTYSQNVLGKNIGYYVEFKNNSPETVDGLKWIASFYDNFGELKGKREGSWESGNIISAMKPGDSTKDLEASYVDGGTKVFIRITQVHTVAKE